MHLDLVFAVMSPIALVAAASAIAFYYRSGMKQVNDYERELKELRRKVLRGEINCKTFRYIEENLKVEDIFNQELKRLNEMLEQNQIDNITFERMKKLLQITFNEKLVKIHTKNLPLIAPN